ncbi:MAG: ATP-binding protein [Polaromonas sp.]|nr:ATP-binding protein [Polaromonas sp.]
MKTQDAQEALRVTQSVAMVRQMPMVLFGNGLSCLFASMAISGSYTFVQRLPMVLGVWILLVPVAISWWRLRRKPAPDRVSPNRIRKLTAYSAVLGFTLGGIMLWYFPGVPFEVSAVITMGCGFMAAGSAAILYIIPLACVLYATPIMLAALYLVATSGATLALPITLLVGLMACGVGWMLYANWRNFHALVRVSHEKTQLLEAAAQVAADKSEFLENMSHEIRNPLTSVIGYANLLREAESQLPARLRPYVKNVVTGGEALKALLNDILDLARLDANHIRLQPVPFRIRELLQDTVSLVSLSAQAKNLFVTASVGHEVPEWLVADPFRLRQVLLNLVGNAIKFTSAGRVDVTAAWLPGRRDSGTLSVRVADTGPGIPDATRAVLFERFSERNAGGTGQIDGSGLGLAICQRLMALMGGGITLEQAKGQGAVFTIRLRAPSSSMPVTRVAASAVTGRIGQMTILVADDMEPNRQLLRLMLEPMGHSVIEAVNGMEVMTLCQQQHFNLILMDIDMPGIDGLMATRLVRTHCRLNSSTPVVAVTGQVTENHLEEFADAGIQDHLTKPLHRAALADKVNAWASAPRQES